MLEQIGENAKKLSQPFKDTHRNIPWKDISNLRNRIAHEYFDIDLDIIWEIIMIEVPELLKFTEKILSETR
jgi:uncharacterized protein with HEPN domain